MNTNNLKIILIIIILDFILSQLFVLDFLNKEKELAYKNILENRVPNNNYKYTFAKNKTFNSSYKDFIYEINTNNLGFRDKANRYLNKNKEYTIIIGDSFVEGVGLNYDETIVGLLNNKLNKATYEKFEFLNAGVSSYSSYIYLRKIRQILKNNDWLKVKSVVLLHDKSDLRDDLAYLEMNEYEKFNFKKIKYSNRRKYFFYEDLKNLNFWRFYRKQTMIGLLTDNIGNRLENFLRDTRDRYKLAKKINQSFFKVEKYKIRAIRSTTNMSNIKNFYYDEVRWAEEGTKSINFTIKNFLELKNFLNSKNINLYILLYPYSYEILDDVPKSRYLDSIIPRLNVSKINYINTYPKFFDGDLYKNIDNFYIYNDIHYNKAGNSIIADTIFNEIYQKLD